MFQAKQLGDSMYTQQEVLQPKKLANNKRNIHKSKNSFPWASSANCRERTTPDKNRYIAEYKQI
jgi:hypothetical protein